MASWRVLLRHATRLAALRALPSDGIRMPMSRAMIAITTRSSMSVNAWCVRRSMRVPFRIEGWIQPWGGGLIGWGPCGSG